MTTRPTTDRRYRVYAHGCYVHGIRHISSQILKEQDPLEAATRFYTKGLDNYPHLKDVVVLSEDRFNHPPNIGPLTIKKVITMDDLDLEVWCIMERSMDNPAIQDHQSTTRAWISCPGVYHSFKEAWNVMKDITRLRDNRLHNLGDILPFGDDETL